MHFDILIVAKEVLTEEHFSSFNILQLPEANFTSPFSITSNDTTITYDYLIIDRLFSLNLLTEDKHIITNDVFETSIDHIYAIGPINRSNKSMSEQLRIISETIRQGDL